MRMHLKPDQALQYLADHNHPMGRSTWFKWKQRLNKTVQERLYEVAQYEFPEQHLHSIEEIRAARQKMWENVERIKDPFKQNIAIQNLINTLPLLSQYYDNTRGVIQKPESTEQETIISESTTVAEEWA
jgi:hypothetical protein